MIRSAFFFLIFLSIGPVFSQSKDNQLTIPGSEKVHFANNSTGIPSYIKLSDKVKLDGLNAWMEKIFKLNKDHEILPIKTEKDELGFTHHKFQQYYKNYPVEGAIYIIHEKDNYIHSLNGMIQDRISIDETVSISESQALKYALNYIKGEKYIWENKNEESHLKFISKDSTATYYPNGVLVIVNDRLGKKAYRLAYKFDIYSIRPLRRAYVYVDASNGKILNVNDRIHHHIDSKKGTCHSNEIEEANTNASGTAATKYSGTQTITTDYTGSTYRLRETGRGNGIQTFNMNRNVVYSAATDFTDSDNIWNTTTNYDNAAYDAHWGAEKTYDYYSTTHSRNSYDGSGGIIKNYVHYDVNYDNAYWDGSRMTYGDGSNTFGGFTALTSIDVVGHEITHGVTEYSANLNYSDESGALNEAFSDIMGTTIEFYAKPASANFLIGDQITVGGGALRSMANPNLYDQPDTYLGNMWDFAQEVHTNSGVANFWYYLVCQGGTGTNDNGSNYSVSGIGMTKAAKIAYRTLTTYLTPNSNYADARFFSIQAAMDLYGPCTAEVQAVTNAWYAVGVGSAYVAGVSADFSANATTFCTTPAVVNFKNLSQNANVFSWNFGDGSALSSASNPSHTYSAYGTYTVTLTATGGSCGSNTMTKTGYIVVSNLATCPVNMPVTGTGQTQTKCTGKLYDSGGQANYDDLSDGTITIAPTGASKVTLSFVSFNFETDYDYLYIYDGPNTSSPLIGAYTGATLPNGGTINSTGGSITINQFSDTYVNESGFECNWSCTTPTAAPVAAFAASPITSCDGIVNFTDLSTNGPTSWAWTFGDGTTSTMQNPVKTYSASGTYTVTLKSCNSIGCSSMLTKTSYVTVNLGTCIYLPQSGTGATQTACSGRLFDSGGSGNYQNGTNGTMTIAPAGATKVTLSFSSFSFESGYDYLYVYDGPTTSSPLIGQFSGSTLPNGGTIISTGGSITLRQVSDGSITMAGFACNWTCTQPTAAPVAAFTATPTSSCDGIVNFTDQSTNGPTSWNWTFGDGTTSTLQNPVKTYSASGSYTVTLKSCNTIGCSSILTKTSYITINLGGCVNIPQTGTGTTQTTCSGRLYDSGGNSDYQNSTNGVITIAPTGASKVNLTFSSFSFESSYDYLYIYDGPSTASPLIGQYSGTTLPGNAGLVSSTGSSITLKQSTDGSVTKPGFVCDWSCVASNSKPSAAFTANTTSSCDGIITFSDLSTNTPTSWKWNFGDGTSSTSKNPVKTYTTNGTYNVSLKACNSFGCDSIVKNSYVTVALSNCVSLPANGTGATQTSCSGRLFDSGGLGNYTNNTNGTITIAPTGASRVTLNFTSFNFESSFDYLYIYDGPNTSSPSLGSFTGTTLPGTISSTGGSITITQYTDVSTVSSGFICDWSCSVNKPAPAFTANPVSTCNGTISFTDNSLYNPTSWTWDFGDGSPTSSSQNPTHTYTTSGIYNVSLTVCNINGCSTLVKNNYINVTLSNCINMPANGTGTTQTSCSGTLYDSGGQNDYGTSTDGFLTLSVTAGSLISLNFSSFSMEDGFDYLFIYDGPNSSGQMLAAITGDSIHSFVVNSISNSITLEQYSDGSYESTGFVCTWSCIGATNNPTPAFSANTNTTCTGTINFTDNSLFNPTSWTWDFGDGSPTSSSQNPTHTYTTSGIYNVSLAACNINGCSTLVKNNYINVTLSNCGINMPANSTGTTQTTCSGTLYDSGGQNDYGTNTHGFLTVSTTAGSKISLNFSSFNMEDGFDYLKIYDGTNSSGQLLATVTGDSSNSFVINSIGNSITLEQYSDGSYQFSGFVCTWSCISGLNNNMLDDSKIDLFPNPASNEISILYSYSGSKDLKIVIYDLLGNAVFVDEGKFTGKYQNKLDVSSFQDGVYLIKIYDGNGSINKKLTITK